MYKPIKYIYIYVSDNISYLSLRTHIKTGFEDNTLIYTSTIGADAGHGDGLGREESGQLELRGLQPESLPRWPAGGAEEDRGRPGALQSALHIGLQDVML